MNESTKAVKRYLDKRLFAFYEEDVHTFKIKLTEMLSYCGKDEAKESLILIALRDADWDYLYQLQAQRFEKEKQAGEYEIPF